MKKAAKIIIIGLLLLASIAFFVVYISTHDVAVINAKGMIGKKERDLIITASILMSLIVIPVFIITWVFALKYRESNEKSKRDLDLEHNNIAEVCWWGVPFLIIIILAVLAWQSSHELDPFKPIVSEKKPVRIQAIALQWKWLFVYPDHGIATINFIQFPEKTPIEFEITADAPMNSFWIPQLGGQIYAMPAMRSKLYLIADESGSYRGVSSNLSGTGFAGMRFTAKASDEGAFSGWVQSVKQSSKNLSYSDYAELVNPTEYVPVSYYSSVQADLFGHILKKYDPQ